MAIKVQPFVIDEAVLDLVGKEFKFDHAKGLAEWLKNSYDAYIRDQVKDDEQSIIIRLIESKEGSLQTIECIDFAGMDKTQIDEAFKRFFDPEAAKKGSKQSQIKTLGGHGNGGKFYMRQMFRTSSALTYRHGKINIFGFNEKKQYGFERDYENRDMKPRDAMSLANIDGISLPKGIRLKIISGDRGFTVIKGTKPTKTRGTSKKDKLIEKLRLHPQARRLIERMPILLISNGDTEPWRLSAPRIIPKEDFEQPVIIEIADTLELEGNAVAFRNKKYSWPGRLTLKTSNDSLRGSLSILNTIDFIGEVGIIASYQIFELGYSRFSGQTEFIFGECECPILEDPENDCVRNDRQKLIETERSTALIRWVREQVEDLAQRMETKVAEERKKQDLKNTSLFNEMLNRWKNRFMNKIWAEVFVGKGPAGVSGSDPGSSDGTGKGGSSETDGDKPGVGQDGGSAKRKKPRFPRVLISGEDHDPLDPLTTEPYQCDKRHPAVYQRRKDVELGIYWINTSRPLAERIISAYSSDSARWRDYLFQRYVDIIIKEGVFQLGQQEPQLNADDINRCIDDITTKVHDEASKDLDSFLFDEQFGLN